MTNQMWSHEKSLDTWTLKFRATQKIWMKIKPGIFHFLTFRALVSYNNFLLEHNWYNGKVAEVDVWGFIHRKELILKPKDILAVNILQ